MEQLKHNNYKADAKERIEKKILKLDLSNKETRSILNSLGPLELPKLNDLTLKMQGKLEENDEKNEVMKIIKNSFPAQVLSLEVKTEENVEIGYWLDILKSAAQRVKYRIYINNFNASLDVLDEALKAFSNTKRIYFMCGKIDANIGDLDNSIYKDSKIRIWAFTRIQFNETKDTELIIKKIARHRALKSSLQELWFMKLDIPDTENRFKNQVHMSIKAEGYKNIKKVKFKKNDYS